MQREKNKKGKDGKDDKDDKDENKEENKEEKKDVNDLLKWQISEEARLKWEAKQRELDKQWKE